MENNSNLLTLGPLWYSNFLAHLTFLLCIVLYDAVASKPNHNTCANVTRVIDHFLNLKVAIIFKSREVLKVIREVLKVIIQTASENIFFASLWNASIYSSFLAELGIRLIDRWNEKWFFFRKTPLVKSGYVVVSKTQYMKRCGRACCWGSSVLRSVLWTTWMTMEFKSSSCWSGLDLSSVHQYLVLTVAWLGLYIA